MEEIIISGADALEIITLLEQIYALGLFVVGVAAAVFVVLVLYRFLKIFL